MGDYAMADVPKVKTRDQLFDRVLYHRGRVSDILTRWRKFCAATDDQRTTKIEDFVSPAFAEHRRRKGEFKVSVLDVIGDQRMLLTAGLRLSENGMKAPGPNGIRVEALSPTELRDLCRELERQIKRGEYVSGPQRVVRIPKSSGKRFRPIVLLNAEDRIVHKAAALCLEPLFEPTFDPLSFAFRRGRTREQAIAVARQLTREGYSHWLIHDLQDAYSRVPVNRLLDVIGRRIPCRRLRNLLEDILRPKDPSLSGIIQGGPLCPLAMEIFLHHFLDRPWRKLGLDAHLIRYADDMLILTRDIATSRVAHDALARILTPAGMLLKVSFEEAQHNIEQTNAQWLGYKFHLLEQRLQIRLRDGVFEKLKKRLLLAHRKAQPTMRAVWVLENWFGQLGPTARWEDRDEICRQARGVAIECGFEEIPDVSDLLELWEQSKARWKQTIKAVKQKMPYYTGALAR